MIQGGISENDDEIMTKDTCRTAGDCLYHIEFHRVMYVFTAH